MDAAPRTRAIALGRWLSTKWWALAVVVVMLYAFPHYPSIRNANELPRLYLVLAIADEGTFAIDRGVARWGGTADMSPYGGHQYSNKAPGSSLLAVPAYVVLRGVTHAVASREPTLGELLWTFRVVTSALPTLCFLWLLWGYLVRFAPDPAARRATLAIYGLGSMALTYSVLFMSHQLAAVCIGSAWILAVRVVDDGWRTRWMLVAGFLAGAAPLMDYQAVFAAVPVAVYVAVRLVRQRAGAAPFVLAAVAAAVPITILLLYHHACFDSPWRTGYAASQTFAHFHERGFLGLDTLRWEAFIGSTIAPDNGLIVFCPALLLALPGWWILARDRRLGDCLVGIAVALIYILFVSGLAFWRGGWQMGPRYITAMLPFLLPAIAATFQALTNRAAVRGLALGLGGVGVAIYTSSRVEFPHFPEKFKNPIFEVTGRLIIDGLAAPNVGMSLGLPGTWSLVPYLVVVLAIWGAVIFVGTDRRTRVVSASVAILITGVVLLAYSQFPVGGDAAEEAYARIVRPAVAAQMSHSPAH